MKALSIKQPWAWAIINLPEQYRKDIENRTWNTKYRGEFLVHASKSFDALGHERMRWYLKELGYIGHIPTKKEFVYGALIGKVELIDVTQKAISRWWEGPFGFKLANAKAFLSPIPYKGILNFFTVDEVITKEQLRLISKSHFEHTQKGHKFIKVSLKEMTGPLRGLGICDSCCNAMFEGYLIPVLNSAYCKKCFDEWSTKAIWYKEDEIYENMKTEQFLGVLNGGH